ncbi:MAG: RagB/SusD family nutrient uptake outer membrane protein [Thermoflavifilum sp.]|uniref:RagB/SusD family nutrient uptake outer membrane protein n=1 Tax=Thermoflavifilum sp. TaxID=1968839 RepID=UPI0018A498B2|nr:RagB/SusD family nutrient uptake outer membrane protein [Thermoflavifilum sp.]QOR76513.1 MAG: RagB/SusD family nutrient uptake outer membrane protein [Thermoflavifilum sp.]
MKNRLSILILTAVTGTSMLLFSSCSNSFLNKPPIGNYDQNTLANRAGVEGLLIGAYSMLDGQGGAGAGIVGSWGTSADNWVFGSVVADDAHKGSDPGDQPDIVPLETWNPTPTNPYLEAKWQALYDAIQRCNDVLRMMRLAKDMTPADTIQVSSEARFLRALYHFEAKKMWNMVPWVDESITYGAGNWKVPNDKDIWPNIEADLQYAMANLPAVQSEAGRANKYAAEAFLAKAYLFEHKYAQAKPLLEDLIQNGVTAGGKKYALIKFSDNFDPAKNHNTPEDVFDAQMSVNDGAGANNANAGDVLNFPYGGGPGGCCGFFQPSYSLVNSFKTDPVLGIPMPDTYNNSDLKNDQGLSSSDPFTPDTTTPLDPRLDWTVGRRGIPYLDWGPFPGAAWIRNQASAGPYAPKKNVYYKSEQGTYTDNSSWTSGYTANNYHYIRFAQVLLWAAEVEVEVGSLDQAEAYVNMVRNRAADPSDWVKNVSGTGYAANYFIKPYPPGYFTLVGQARARTLVHFEEKLELAMEGHRFFDLVRWGEADSTLNAYAAHEVASGYTLMQGAHFTKGKNEYFPIPQQEIDRSTVNGQSVLKQNPGY